MSKNCNYVYVQGLRFRPEDVTVLWKDAAGAEHSVKLRKTGTGKALFDENGVPVSLTPKDLKNMLRKGETVNVVVHAMGGDRMLQEEVMLRLDPRQAEGRKGRRSFDPASLAGLPQSARIALALEQLKNAPYGAENRDEAVDRLYWSLQNLPNDVDTDATIASMLSPDTDGDRSASPAELAALLLSDTTLVASLMREGHHNSLDQLLKITPLAAATLADSPHQAAEVLAAAAAVLLGDGSRPSGDPARYVHAVRYVTDQAVLGNLASDADREVRLAAAKRVTDQAVLGNLASDADREVRLEAALRITDQAVLGNLLSASDQEVRSVAAGRITDRAVLRNLVSDPDRGVRKAAFFALHRDQYQGMDWEEKLVLMAHAASKAADTAVLTPALEELQDIDEWYPVTPEMRIEWANEFPTHPPRRGLLEQTIVRLVYDHANVNDNPNRRRMWPAGSKPSDEILECLLTGPQLDERHGDPSRPSDFFARGEHRHFVASLLETSAARARVAGNTAFIDDVRAVAVAGIRDAADREPFTDSSFPTSVRCAAIVGENWDYRTSVERRAKPQQLDVFLPLPRVIELASDPDPEVRKHAVWALRDESTLREVLTGDDDGTVIRVAAESLLEMGKEDSAVQAGLLETLATSLSRRTFDEQVREVLVTLAVRSVYLLSRDDPKALASVARALPAPEVRLQAVEAMARVIGDSDPEESLPYQEVLVDVATKDADAAVRESAASHIRDQKALSDLLRTSPDEHVRTALVGNVVNVEVLARVVGDDASPSTRQAAVLRLIEGYAGSTANARANARDALHAAAKGDSDPKVRWAALSVYSDPDVCADVARNDADPAVRSHAVAFVRDRDVLADIATKDPDPQVRAQALGYYNSF